ncbi:MAG: RadC family protein [Clostridia bacterium]|nr:RadC family protein [Clostridia bacterium]
MHEGHRSRIRNKLDSSALADHELLEIVLFTAVPRQNTNELAHRLLAQFGSFWEVLNAPFKELCAVKGVGESVAGFLVSLGKIYARIDEDRKQKLRYYGRFDTVSFLPFVKETYQNVGVEVAELYLLDGESRILASKRFSTQSIDSVQLSSSELLAFLSTEGASGVVMVHNHPNGSANVSQEDDQMTAKLQMLCSMHNLLLCDHIIYAPNGMYSYYLNGDLQNISQKYSSSNLFERK